MSELKTMLTITKVSEGGFIVYDGTHLSGPPIYASSTIDEAFAFVRTQMVGHIVSMHEALMELKGRG